ncbi:TPA: hypothetical protein HA251_03105 [Candidatus Woesearchaeota archaeon]|nr:hypothetical protein [Candidatus Woesearchaeota archaeon]
MESGRQEEDAVDSIVIKDHLEKDETDSCGYCGQVFGPDELAIERNIHGRKWRFCSDECYRDFLDASNFKDEDIIDGAETKEDPYSDDDDQDDLDTHTTGHDDRQDE